MKQLFPWMLLLFCAGCAKMHYEYAVICDYPVINDAGPSWLVVSNDAGSILKIFELPKSSSSLAERFDYEASDASETYNLHFIRQRDTAASSTVVLSYYSVPNGAAVTFSNPALSATTKSNQLFLHDVGAADMIHIPGTIPFNWVYTPPTTLINLAYPPQADLLIRIYPPDSSVSYSAYVNTAALSVTDSISLERADFLPDHFLTISPPGSGPIRSLQVSAVQADFKRFVTLFQAGAQSGFISNKIPLPANPYPDGFLQVRMRQEDFTFERIFPPGGQLEEKPQIAVTAALFSPYHSLQIATAGNPDMVEAISNAPAPDAATRPFHWTIKGPPEAFVHMLLPDLSVLLPALRTPGPGDFSWQVTAIRYDHLDYNQLLAGFPYKGNDGRVFPTARYGLQMVTRNF